MTARECYHCKEMISDFKTHDCWSTTEQALLAECDDDFKDAFERLRETAVEFGEQRIYASHKSIMFSRKACYFFVRPQSSRLEVCIFLPREIRDARVKKTHATSRTKTAHLVYVVHRDEVEEPLTDWLREAYEFAGEKTPSSRAEGKIATETKSKPTERTVGARGKVASRRETKMGTRRTTSSPKRAATARPTGRKTSSGARG